MWRKEKRGVADPVGDWAMKHSQSGLLFAGCTQAYLWLLALTP